MASTLLTSDCTLTTAGLPDKWIQSGASKHPDLPHLIRARWVHRPIAWSRTLIRCGSP